MTVISIYGTFWLINVSTGTPGKIKTIGWNDAYDIQI